MTAIAATAPSQGMVHNMKCFAGAAGLSMLSDYNYSESICPNIVFHSNDGCSTLGFAITLFAAHHNNWCIQYVWINSIRPIAIIIIIPIKRTPFIHSF